MSDENLIKKFGMQSCKSIATPVNADGTSEAYAFKYRSVVGVYSTYHTYIPPFCMPQGLFHDF